MALSLRNPDAAAVRRVAAAVSVARAGVGLALLIFPRASLRLAGLDGGKMGAEGRFFLRSMAVREISVAAAVLAECSRGLPSPTLLGINAGTDFADALVLAAGRGGPGMRRMTLLGLPTSIAATATWIWARRHLDR